MDDRPIGVFDSGVGGLTVFREITRALPSERLVYLGDTARLPYGTKSAETVTRYALEDAQFLMEQGVKLVVVACNTASAYGLAALRERLPVPVVGVVEPGARQAVAATRSKVVGVIGTEATIKSGAYQRAISSMAPSVKLVTRACPLFVSLVEEGWAETQVARLTAQTYLAEFEGTGVDVLVLGCTHYPLLKGVLSDILGPGVSLVDSAEETAVEVKRLLSQSGGLNGSGFSGRHRFYLTDVFPRFVEVGERFLGSGVGKVYRAELGDGGRIKY